MKGSFWYVDSRWRIIKKNCMHFKGCAQMDEDELVGFYSKQILRYKEDLREWGRNLLLYPHLLKAKYELLLYIYIYIYIYIIIHNNFK